MPRNGSGVYTLPAGNPVISGTTISSVTQNNTMSDVASELTNSIAADGQKSPTANLPMGNFKHTGVGNATSRDQYASAGQVQDSSLVWCGTAAGTANALEFSPIPAISAYAIGQSFKFKAGAAANTGATTISVSGLAAIDLQISGLACSGGEIQPNLIYEVFIDSLTTAQLRDVSKSVDAGTSIITIAASVASNILTCTLNPVSLDFRSATLGSGVVNTRTVPSAITVAVPSTATLGTSDGVLARLILIAIDNAGTVELAISNWLNSSALDESGLISTTTVSTAADSAGVFYSTVGRSNVPYRVLGFVEVTPVTAGVWVTPSKIQGFGGEALIYLGVQNAPLRSFISGYTLSTAGASTTLSISAGQCSDSTNLANMVLSSALAKTTSAWALGNAVGGLDTGAIANSTWYHFYSIRRPDTGAVDVIFSLSASAPTLPANFTQYRRIGSAKTNGLGQWVTFVQDGDLFQLDVAVLDVDATAPGSAAVTRTLGSVPTGVNVIARLHYAAYDPTNANQIIAYLSDLSVSDQAPSGTVSPLGSSVSAATNSTGGLNYLQVRTNTSAQIRSRVSNAGGTVVLKIATLGWIDTRGRDK